MFDLDISCTHPSGAEMLSGVQPSGAEVLSGVQPPGAEVLSGVQSSKTFRAEKTS